MRHAPTISIVMPVRNAAARLPVALESIRAQSFTDWELVVVDDGSTDETPLVLRAAAAADARIRLQSQPALGIAAALQRGCAAARGAVIARMDADDWMAPQRLRRQLDFLERHPHIGLVSCQVRHGGDPTTQSGYAAHVAWLNSLRTPEAIALRRFVDSPVAHPSVMFRRELLAQHGGYAAGDFPEDYELWLRWMDAGVQCGKVAEELLQWNDPPDRLSRTEARYRPEAFYRLKSGYLARWLRRHVAPGREVWLWGAGRITRQRFRALEAAGVSIAGFIDVDRNKLGRLRDGRPVVGPDQLPPAARAFIVTGVSVRGARDWIAAELRRRGRVEGADYLLAA
jgi:glycosyltransferase involved in cell wall biosynthesis